MVDVRVQEGTMNVAELRAQQEDADAFLAVRNAFSLLAAARASIAAD